MAPARVPCTDMRDLKWSPAEKAIARQAFDLALRRKLDAVMEEAKRRAARIGQPSELWDLERFLTRHRKQIDATFDFRYSALPFVFAILVREGLLAESDLHGLAEDKLDLIRSGAAIASDPPGR